MIDDRRMTTDRFYGGTSNRLRNLVSMLEHINKEEPPRDELTNWIISNTNADSPDAVNHHLPFLDSIDLIELNERRCALGHYGEEYLANQDNETLYECLSSGVKGFDTLLKELDNGPMTDEDIMDLLVEEFEEAEMSKPGPAIRHREWLQVLGYVKREDDVNRLTEEGRELLRSRQSGTSLEQAKVDELRSKLMQNEISCVPPGRHHVSEDIYPQVKAEYPELCNDDYLCEEAHEAGKDQAEWKHVVRDVQKQLADKENSRVRSQDEYGLWLYLPRFEQGETYERQKLHDKYSGNRQRGISPSAQFPLVFLFTGSSGEKYGYKDEFLQDGTVVYTGEGQTGDMTYDEGNKAVAEHAEDGRELHLFKKEGDGMVSYVGQYECVDSFQEELRDKEGNLRSGIRFELQPVDAETETTETGTSETAEVTELPGGQTTAEKRKVTTTRTERDSAVVNTLKELYENTCQVCGQRRLKNQDEGYSNVHHLKPLADDGPDVPGNVVVVCPNHHADFENGMLTVDPETLEIDHEYESEVSGSELLLEGEHEVESEYLEYHNREIVR
jgi:5-methylcytosine-specific restriction protein A